MQFWQLVEDSFNNGIPPFKERIFIVLVGITVFAFPIYLTSYNAVYVTAHYKNKITYLFDFINQYAKNKPIYFFAATTVYAFPAIDYCQSIHASRFAFLGWVPAVLKQNNIEAKNYYLDLMSEDFQLNKPAYVFVDIKDIKANLEENPVNFVSYFSTDKNFQKVWKNYSYFTTIDQSPAYKFAVYKLI